MYIDYLFLISSAIMLFFAILFLFGYFESKDGDPVPKKNYDVSIIIPIWNEEGTIGKTIDSLIKMEKYYKGKLQIIVSDNNSKDDSVKIVKGYVKKYNFIDLVYAKKQQGKDYAFNYAVDFAKYDLIACVDADSYPDKDSLDHIVGYFDDSKMGVVTTKMIVKDPSNIVEMFQDVEYLYSNFLLTAFKSLGSIYVARGPLSVYRKDLFQKIGGFYPSTKTPAEDMEITFRIRKEGFRVESSKTAKVYTSVMPTWRKLLWQRIRWNRGSMVNFWMHKDMAFDPKYGFFGVVMYPIVSLTVAMIWVVLYFFLVRFYNSIYHYAYKIFWYIYLQQVPNVYLFLKYYFTNAIFFLPSLFFLFIFIVGTWALLNFLGFFESKERMKFKRLLFLLLSPFIYMPMLIVFWVAAIYLQFFKYSYRWR